MHPRRWQNSVEASRYRRTARVPPGRRRGDIDIVRVASIEQAQPGDLTFVANARYLASCATRGIRGHPRRRRRGRRRRAPVLRSDDPYSTFAQAVALFMQTAPPAKGVDRLERRRRRCRDRRRRVDRAVRHRSAPAPRSARARSSIPTSSSEPGARIGDDCVIHAHASIRERVVLGNRVIIQNGAVIGSDGFGFVRQTDGTHLKIPQHADVVIEDDVEIGANTTIDRPAVGETRIRAGTKIDNLVQIAHGVTMGRRVLLAAQVGIAGSTTSTTTWCWPGRWASPGICGRRGRRRDRADRHSELRGRRRVRLRLSGDRQPGLAEGVGRVPPAAGAEKTDRGARSSGSPSSRRSSRNAGHAGSLSGARPPAACLPASSPPVAAQSPAPPATRRADFLTALRLHLVGRTRWRRRPALYVGRRTGAATSTWSTTSSAARRSWPTTRRCSATSSARSIRTRGIYTLEASASSGAGRPRSPASSTTCRGISAIGRQAADRVERRSASRAAETHRAGRHDVDV